jgi:hypothetical protein
MESMTFWVLLQSLALIADHPRYNRIASHRITSGGNPE